MEPFDQKGALNDALGHHSSKNIPEALRWEQMGPKIQAQLAADKKRRRVFWWWLPLGLLTVTAFCYLLAALNPPPLAQFPVPVVNASTDSNVNELTEDQEEPSPSARVTNSHLLSVEAALPPATKKMRTRVSRKTITLNSAEMRAVNTQVNKSASKESTATTGKATENTLAAVGENTGVVSANSVAPRSASPVEKIITLLVFPVMDSREEEVRGVVEECVDVPFNNRKYPWRMEAAVGTNSYRSLANQAPPSLPPGKSEALTGFTGNILVGRPIGAGSYSWWTGLAYQELVQRERFTDEFILQLYQPNTLDTIFRNLITGEETFVYTDSVAGVRRIEVQQHNTFRTYAVPVILRRQWDRQAWPLALQMGVDVNWAQWEKGKTLTADAQLVETNTTAALGLGVRLGAQVYSPRTRFGRLFVRVSYQRLLKTYSGTRNGSAFRPASINFMLGVPLRH